ARTARTARAARRALRTVRAGARPGGLGPHARAGTTRALAPAPRLLGRIRLPRRTVTRDALTGRVLTGDALTGGFPLGRVLPASAVPRDRRVGRPIHPIHPI
ncbi:hypothetical protein, partial [Streptomyces sp. IBSBF 2394]|uniref:hypothetical protein n=1 Tax=Streptomyces sp. IBSBF 2394 TaxID=2903532 RepID=UPI002FDBE8D6